jgi:hypothetical protein
VQALGREVAAAAEAAQQAHQQLQQVTGPGLQQQERRLRACSEQLHGCLFLRPSDAAPELTQPQLREALAYLDDMSSGISDALTDASSRFVSRAAELERKPQLQEQRRVLQLMMSDVSVLPALLAEVNQHADRLEAQRAYL